jgi:cell division protein FtsI/penicillin-binding protein 2
MIRGLFDVYNLGTASTLRVRHDIAGKTGTAENFAKIGERIQLKDHSIFVAFALRTTQNRHCNSGRKWRVWSDNSWTNC